MDLYELETYLMIWPTYLILEFIIYFKCIVIKSHLLKQSPLLKNNLLKQCIYYVQTS